MKTGALIVTAGKRNGSTAFEPMLKVGSISAVRRLIRTFELSGVNIITVVADRDASALRRHISGFNVVYLENSDSSKTEMLDFVKLGLSYLQTRCDRVLLTPVDIPLFTSDTVKRLMQTDCALASPVQNGKKGHPLLLSNKLIPSVLHYSGGGGLRGALSLHEGRELVNVNDAGILFDVELDRDYSELLSRHNHENLHPEVKVSLVKEDVFFDADSARLLSLIEETDSVRLASGYMGISYSKAWKLIDTMENALNLALVTRRQGGKSGGGASLTTEARDLLDRYYDFENALKASAQKLFSQYFE